MAGFGSFLARMIVEIFMRMWMVCCHGAGDITVTLMTSKGISVTSPGIVKCVQCCIVFIYCNDSCYNTVEYFFCRTWWVWRMIMVELCCPEWHEHQPYWQRGQLGVRVYCQRSPYISPNKLFYIGHGVICEAFMPRAPVSLSTGLMTSTTSKWFKMNTERLHFH